MRKLGILMISILISVTAYADGIQYFDHVRSMYEQGRYEEALQGFTACKKLYYDELDIASIDNWINTCNSKIKERNAAVQAKRQAEIAKAKFAEERRAHEEKQKKIVEKKLLFVSSNAFLFDKEYTGMHQAIKGYIADNSEQRFTDDSEMAYWCVYVTANAYEYNMNNNTYFSNVTAYIKITNEITKETIYENEVVEKGGSSMNYTVAAEKAYRNINKNIGIRIIEQLK